MNDIENIAFLVEKRTEHKKYFLPKNNIISLEPFENNCYNQYGIRQQK